MTGAADGTVRLDAPDHAEVRRLSDGSYVTSGPPVEAAPVSDALAEVLRHLGRVRGVAPLRGGAFVALDDGLHRLTDTGKDVCHAPFQSGAPRVPVATDGRYVAAVAPEGVVVWSARSCKPLAGRTGDYRDVGFVDHSLVAWTTAGGLETLRLPDLARVASVGSMAPEEVLAGSRGPTVVTSGALVLPAEGRAVPLGPEHRVYPDAGLVITLLDGDLVAYDADGHEVARLADAPLRELSRGGAHGAEWVVGDTARWVRQVGGAFESGEGALPAWGATWRGSASLTHAAVSAASGLRVELEGGDLVARREGEGAVWSVGVLRGAAAPDAVRVNGDVVVVRLGAEWRMYALADGASLGRVVRSTGPAEASTVTIPGFVVEGGAGGTGGTASVWRSDQWGQTHAAALPPWTVAPPPAWTGAPIPWEGEARPTEPRFGYPSPKPGHAPVETVGPPQPPPPPADRPLRSDVYLPPAAHLTDVDGDLWPLPLTPGRPTLVVLGPPATLSDTFDALGTPSPVDVLWVTDPSNASSLPTPPEGLTVAVAAPSALSGLGDATLQAGALLLAADGAVTVPSDPGAVHPVAAAEALALRSVPDVPRLVPVARWTAPAPVIAMRPLMPARSSEDKPGFELHGAALVAWGSGYGLLEPDGGLRWSVDEPVGEGPTLAYGRTLASTGATVVARSVVGGSVEWSRTGRLLGASPEEGFTVLGRSARPDEIVDLDGHTLVTQVGLSRGLRFVDGQPLSSIGGLCVRPPDLPRAQHSGPSRPAPCPVAAPPHLGAYTVQVEGDGLVAASGDERAWVVAGVTEMVTVDDERVLAHLGAVWVLVDADGRVTGTLGAGTLARVSGDVIWVASGRTVRAWRLP